MNRLIFIGLAMLFVSQVAISKPLTAFVDETVVKTVKPRHVFLNDQGISDLDRRHSGYVEFTLMVNEGGTAEKISTVYASHLRFEENALEALKRYVFTPASFENKPVSSKARIRVFFNADVPRTEIQRDGRRIKGGEEYGGLTPMFLELHKTFRELYEEEQPDLTRMADLITAMSRLSFVETIGQMLLSLDRYFILEKQGATQGKVRALKSALFFDDRIQLRYYQLKENERKFFEETLLSLLLEEKRYAEFLEMYMNLKAGDKRSVSAFTQAANQITSLKEQASPFQRQVLLNPDGRAFELLLHRGFELDVEKGSLSKIVARCEQKFLELTYQPQTYLSFPEKWGQCEVELIGDPQSSLILIEG